MPARIDVATRFAQKVRIGPDCHEWLGATGSSGHGLFWFGGALMQAHRAAWELEKGSPPTGHLLHSCDNPICVRVDHLREGTQADNMADMVARGRQCAGEAKPNARLTSRDASDIRIAHGLGASMADLARAFGVHRATVRDVVTGRRWKEA